MREILLATGNPNKAREMKEILSACEGGLPPVRWRQLAEFPGIPEPVEDGDTFIANARLDFFLTSSQQAQDVKFMLGVFVDFHANHNCRSSPALGNEDGLPGR